MTLGDSRVESRLLKRQAPSSEEQAAGCAASSAATTSTRSMFFRAVHSVSTKSITWSQQRPAHTPGPLFLSGLTVGPPALPGGPQVEQSAALVQQGVGILHTDAVDVVHAEVQLAGQL